MPPEAPLPPARAETAIPAEEAGPRPRPERRPEQTRTASREDAVRALVSDYLDLWSAANPLALAATDGLYAPVVIFHGRTMSMRALVDEKRRFIQRWPERRYHARDNTMGIACGPGGETCTVRTVFDFAAADPRSGRRSQGVATLELVVRFAEDGRPVITAENSLVHGRSRAASLAPGDDDLP